MKVMGILSDIRLIPEVRATGTPPAGAPASGSRKPMWEADRYEPSSSRPPLPVITYSRGGT